MGLMGFTVKQNLVRMLNLYYFCARPCDSKMGKLESDSDDPSTDLQLTYHQLTRSTDGDAKCTWDNLNPSIKQ